MKDQTNSSGINFKVSCSYLEIYNELVQDILNKSRKKVKLGEDPKSKRVYGEKLNEVIVSNPQMAYKKLGKGTSRRATGST